MFRFPTQSENKVRESRNHPYVLGNGVLIWPWFELTGVRNHKRLWKKLTKIGGVHSYTFDEKPNRATDDLLMWVRFDEFRKCSGNYGLSP